ncbi:transposase family protein [Streptomyces sp. NPDC057302]|uniref:helix-turn-helix domain-containing protein n=1 Tax=Streptomyces sp. NPDC057302 TaxID=3346094 RepID=UPI00362DB6E0
MLQAARGGPRRRAAGAGRKPKLVFFDRLLLTLVHLRHQLPQAVLAELFDVDRSPSPRPSGRSARCSQPVASPCPTGPAFD